MHGVPADLDLSRYIGSSLIWIGLCEFQICFDFMREGGDPPGITVEGAWQLRDSSNNLIDQATENRVRESYRLHKLLGRTVTSSSVDAPLSFSLTFDDGHRLEIFDDSTQYESFSIGDIIV